MSLAYGKPTDAIGKKLRSLYETEFNNVYLSDKYEETGNEGIRIDLLSSNLNEQISSTMEIRDYDYEITIYNHDTSDKHYLHLNNRVDRAVYLLMKNRTLSGSVIDLVVQDVNYKAGTESVDLLAGSFTATITKENIF